LVIEHIRRPGAAAWIFIGPAFAAPMHEVIRLKHLVTSGIRSSIEKIISVDANHVRVCHSPFRQQWIAIGLVRLSSRLRRRRLSNNEAGREKRNQQKSYLNSHSSEEL